MRTLISFIIVSCFGLCSACSLLVEVKDPPGDCGDNQKNGGEQCDGSDLGGETCESLGFEDPDGGGQLGCNANCTYNTASCSGTCGDGTRQAQEACEGTDLGGETCQTRGFLSGTLVCTGECTFDTSGCEGPLEICGDGEDNDGDGLWDCDDNDCAGHPTCEGEYCGDQVANGEEECDGDDFRSESCMSLFGVPGDLYCTETCKFDFSFCELPVEECNDGVDNDGDGFSDCADSECATDPICMIFPTCGDYQVSTGEVCDGTNLNGQICQSQGFLGGVLRCNASCDGFDLSGCNNCGNLIVNAGEQCDGAVTELTCADQGWGTGPLSCTPFCTLDSSACSNPPICGNGSIDPGPGEDCDGANLAGRDCYAFGFSGGELACDPTTCKFNFIACSSTAPLPPPTLISAGAAHTCTSSSSGVYCWGLNFFGGLGVGSSSPYLPVPLPVTYQGTTIVADDLAAGGSHSCAVTTIGSTPGAVLCWGDNGSGQLGDGSGFSSPTPVVVPGLSGITRVVTGYEHTCALQSDRTVVCWGSNIFKQLGDPTVVDYSNTPNPVFGLTNIIQLSAGTHHNCAIKEISAGNTQLFCWGMNNKGQVGNNTTTDVDQPAQISGPVNPSSVDCGGEHTCATTPLGEVWCWGENNQGQLGIVGLASSSVPYKNPGFTAISVSAGYDHSCAVVNPAGELACWGSNPFGQLGLGHATTPIYAPTFLGGLSGFRLVTSGGAHTCSIYRNPSTNMDYAYCWGGNWYGQLGDGSNLDRWSSGPVLGQ